MFFETECIAFSHYLVTYKCKASEGNKRLISHRVTPWGHLVCHSSSCPSLKPAVNLHPVLWTADTYLP